MAVSKKPLLVNAKNYNHIQKLSLVLLFLFILLLINACGTQPEPVSNEDVRQPSEQTPKQKPTLAVQSAKVDEQVASPTPQFDTVEIKPEDQIISGDLQADDLQSTKNADCPGLENMLFEISKVPDPISLAKQLQLNVKDDKLQVLLILASEDTNFLQNFDIEPETQVGSQVQAYIPIDQLCPLANTDEVLAIRLPDQALPQ